MDFLNDWQVDALMGVFLDKKFPKRYEILFHELIRKWAKIHNPSKQLYWVSPKNGFVCPMFFSDWRVVDKPELVRANWLSDIALREVIIPEIRKSSKALDKNVAQIFETLFLGGVGAGALTSLNKEFDFRDTEWKDSEFYKFFMDFMEKDCPLKHFLRHLTLVAERFAEGVVMGPFPTLDAVAKALNVKLCNLSKTPNLAAWEGEFFRICRQYNRIPSTKEGSRMSFNDFIADFDSPISVTMIRDLAALVCGWDALTTLDGRDAFNALMSALGWWQHQVDPVYNPADGKMWFFVQCSAGFGRKDLAAAYHFYSLFAMSHMATQRIMETMPEVIPQFSRPSVGLGEDSVVVGNPRLLYTDSTSLKQPGGSEPAGLHVKDYTPPPGRPLSMIQHWETITKVQCFIHTSDAENKDFRRGLWKPLALATTKKRKWKDFIRRETELFHHANEGIRVFRQSHSNEVFSYFACQRKENNTFWFSLNPVKSHQYELASNANALEAFVRSTSRGFLPYVVSYDDWAIPGILEPDDPQKYTRQLRILRISTIICKSAKMALATGVMVRELGLRMANEKFVPTWFSEHTIEFLKGLQCPLDLSFPGKGTSAEQILRTCGSLNCWILRQNADVFEAMNFPIKARPTTLLGKKLDFVNQTISLDSKKKDEHLKRFQDVLASRQITIAEFLKVSGVMIHWAEGSRVRRNLVSPLFKTIIKSISPLVIEGEVKGLLEREQFSAAIALMQKKWKSILKWTPAAPLSSTEANLLKELTPMFLDPLPAKPILYRICDVPPERSFCSDATKKTFGGHTMSLLGSVGDKNLSHSFPRFWWALDFTLPGRVACSKQGRFDKETLQFWEQLRVEKPSLYGFFKLLSREPVHNIEFLALMITVLLYKNRIVDSGDFAKWSPFLPLKFYCDNQATVSRINSGFSLNIFQSSDLDRKLLDFEILCNILFQDILTIPIHSPAGHLFLKRELPHLRLPPSFVEVTILPIYVHTSLCTADHLTRGSESMLNGTPIKRDNKKCIDYFVSNRKGKGKSRKRDLTLFDQEQVSIDELFRAISFIRDRMSVWASKLRTLRMTCWKRNQALEKSSSFGQL